MPHERERIGVFDLKDVLPFVPKKGTQRRIRRYAGEDVSISKKKLRFLVKNGTKCVCCGVKGSFLALERHKKGAKRWHFNLYALDAMGNEIEMTLDHIVPRAQGGTRDSNNLQLLCEPCNLEKGDTSTLPRRVGLTPILDTQTNLTKLSKVLRPFVQIKTKEKYLKAWK